MRRILVVTLFWLYVFMIVFGLATMDYAEQVAPNVFYIPFAQKETALQQLEKKYPGYKIIDMENVYFGRDNILRGMTIVIDEGDRKWTKVCQKF